MAIAVAAIGSRPDFAPYVALQTSRSGPEAQLDTLALLPGFIGTGPGCLIVPGIGFWTNPLSCGLMTKAMGTVLHIWGHRP